MFGTEQVHTEPAASEWPAMGRCCHGQPGHKLTRVIPTPDNTALLHLPATPWKSLSIHALPKPSTAAPMISARSEYQGPSDGGPRLSEEEAEIVVMGGTGRRAVLLARKGEQGARCSGKAASRARAVPGCRRPSLGAAGPATPGGSPGTAAALRAGSSWRRAPWSLQGRQRWVSCVRGRRAPSRHSDGSTCVSHQLARGQPRMQM